MNTDTEERTTLADFITARKITATAAVAPSNPDMHTDIQMDHWRVTLIRPHTISGHKRPQMTVYFSMGTGHNGKQPTAADVLDCLASDSASIENAARPEGPATTLDAFEYWAREMGYDTDSRKAHRTWTICQRQAARLRKFLGEDDYKLLLWETERL